MMPFWRNDYNVCLFGESKVISMRYYLLNMCLFLMLLVGVSREAGVCLCSLVSLRLVSICMLMICLLCYEMIGWLCVGCLNAMCRWRRHCLQ